VRTTHAAGYDRAWHERTKGSVPPVAPILAQVATVFSRVTPILAKIAVILTPIAPAPLMTCVAQVLAMIAAILLEIPDILTTVDAILDPIAPLVTRRLCERGRRRQ
jgi:hypothetical protein